MEFDPIFPAGFHDITLDKLEEIFVDPFPENERRAYLTRRFRDYLTKVSEFGLKVEIWVDGSYSTYKPQPGDMDILIIYDAKEVNKLPVDKRPVLEELFDRDLCKIRYSIDVLLCQAHDIDLRSYWRGWFGFSRDENPKGIPRVSYGVN